jgi:hypothetical protein
MALSSRSMRCSPQRSGVLQTYRRDWMMAEGVNATLHTAPAAQQFGCWRSRQRVVANRWRVVVVTRSKTAAGIRPGTGRAASATARSVLLSVARGV